MRRREKESTRQSNAFWDWHSRPARNENHCWNHNNKQQQRKRRMWIEPRNKSLIFKNDMPPLETNQRVVAFDPCRRGPNDKRPGQRVLPFVWRSLCSCSTTCWSVVIGIRLGTTLWSFPNAQDIWEYHLVQCLHSALSLGLTRMVLRKLPFLCGPCCWYSFCICTLCLPRIDHGHKHPGAWIWEI